MSYKVEMPETTCYPVLKNLGITREYIKMMGNPLVERKIIITKDKKKWVYIKEDVWCVLFKDYNLYMKKRALTL